MHHLFLFQSILAESGSMQFLHQNGQMVMMYKLKKNKKLHSKGQKLASQNNRIENNSNLTALWPLPSPCLHTLTDAGPLSVAQEVLAMLTPFLLFIRFWQLFNKRCVRKGVLVGWTTTWYLVNCTHEKQCQSKLQCKTFLTSPFMTTAITRMSGKVSLSSLYVTLLAYIFTASVPLF